MNTPSCSAADTGLHVYVDGKVGLCCSGSFPLGNIKETAINDIFSSQKFIEIQQSLHNNQSHNYCSGCDRTERIAPGSSQRSAFNNQFKSNGERHVRLADIRWSNVCNLSCRYCNVNDSSEWRRLMNLPVGSANKDYTDTLFDYVTENRDSLEALYLLGGEPLLQKQNEKLLSIVKLNTKIDLLTNMSVKLDNNKIYQSLKNFNNVYWNLSFDNVGERFEYVRQGAAWDVLTTNIDRLLDDFGVSHVSIHPVYHIWNATNLEEFYEFADKRGMRVNWQLGLEKFGDPYATDAYLTFGHKRAIIIKAVDEINKLKIQDPILLGIRDSLMLDTEIKDKDKKFLSWTARMEQFMPPAKSFEKLWPELNTILNLP